MALSVNQQTFTQEVLESPTLVLVNFWAPWCGICRRVDPLLARLQAEWGESLKLVSINADENFKLANQYRLATLPTMLLFEGGQVLYRFDSFRGSESLQGELDRMVSSHLLTRPSSPDTIQELAISS
ncbi:thioredoxin family protein [Neosynechococcus sphagnicola]|uniref:thioredoxin family protein n=1 Tax=Neosynechococcus sphagnicola TaxID=1501145 RepID=UPI00056A3198|nr:thioredoxin domain-containing protein [Neosynechococcus sphagnicola]